MTLFGISVGKRMAEIKENGGRGNDGACRSLVPVVCQTMRSTQFGRIVGLSFSASRVADLWVPIILSMLVNATFSDLKITSC